MIVDDHRVVSDGLTRLIEEGKEAKVVATAATLEQTETLLKEHKPQVLFLDVALPDGDGIDAIPSLLALSPQTHIVILTMFAEAAVVNRALEAHAMGYVFKSADAAELHNAIRTVMNGETYLCEEAKTLLSDQATNAPLLTIREREVLKLIAEGYTMKEIAAKLCLGFETVHSYTKTLRIKLGCNNTASLVRKALEQHLV